MTPSVWLVVSWDNGSESFIHGAYTSEAKAWIALSNMEGAHPEWSNYLGCWVWLLDRHHGVTVQAMPLDQPATGWPI